MSGQCGSKSLRSWLDCWWAVCRVPDAMTCCLFLLAYSFHQRVPAQLLPKAQTSHPQPLLLVYQQHPISALLCWPLSFQDSILFPGWWIFGKDFVLFLLPLEWSFWREPSKSHHPCFSNKPPLECEEWGTPLAQQRHWVCRPWTLHFQNW